MSTLFLLNSEQMRAAEQHAIASGIASAKLMETAGNAVADHILASVPKGPVLVLCGPGNNGGDGFVIARYLHQAQWDVRLSCMTPIDSLRGDAKVMAGLYDGPVVPFEPAAIGSAAIIVDALFGTGLERPIEGDCAKMIAAVNASPAPVVAVDLPSGVAADSGQVLGIAVQAAITVSFFAHKIGHVCFPGRGLCGQLLVKDIGISPGVLAQLDPKIAPKAALNNPALWGHGLPRLSWDTHKYSRGEVRVLSGPVLATGAARLSARAALRAGAGVVTLLSPEGAAAENAAQITAIMQRIVTDADDWQKELGAAPKAKGALVLGPGAGTGEVLRGKVLAALKSDWACVCDADALTSFEEKSEAFFDALREQDVLTPHEGEFARLFPDLLPDGVSSKLERVRAAALRAGCVVVLKGPDSVVAHPDGRAVVNTNGVPDLATAGAGDVLAGFIAALIAQGMPSFDAASAGVWMHGACAQLAGPGLIAEDLPEQMPALLRQLFAPQNARSDGNEEAGERGGEGA